MKRAMFMCALGSVGLALGAVADTASGGTFLVNQRNASSIHEWDPATGIATLYHSTQANDADVNLPEGTGFGWIAEHFSDYFARFVPGSGSGYDTQYILGTGGRTHYHYPKHVTVFDEKVVVMSRNDATIWYYDANGNELGSVPTGNGIGQGLCTDGTSLYASFWNGANSFFERYDSNFVYQETIPNPTGMGNMTNIVDFAFDPDSGRFFGLVTNYEQGTVTETNTVYEFQMGGAVVGTYTLPFLADGIGQLILDGGESVLYFSEDYNGNGLYTLDMNTGAATNIGISGVTSATVGLAPAPSPALLYGSKWSILMHINSDGSGSTDVGGAGTEGLAFDHATGTLYGAINGNFFTMDPATGNQLLTLASPGYDIEGIAFGNGGVYGIEGYGGSSTLLFWYDPGTNAWNIVGDTGVDWHECGLAYDPGGNMLYAKGSQDSYLYRIDPATAATTMIGDTGIQAGGGLAIIGAGGPPPCPPDVNGDGVVDVLDLLLVLAAWGAPGGPEDINGDGIVDVLDLLEILAAWGPCDPVGDCEHEVVMYDDYGDGWNGGFIDIYINGVLTYPGVTLPSGSGPESFFFMAPNGGTIETVFTAGGWPYECYYYIYDGAGTEICSDGLGGLEPTGCTCTGYCP